MVFILLWCAALTPYWNALAPDQKEHIDAFSELCTMYTVVKCMKAYRLFIKVSGCIDPINDRVAAAMELATNLLNEHMVADNLSCRALYLQDRDTLEKLHSLVLEIWRIQVDCNGAIHASVTGRHVCQLTAIADVMRRRAEAATKTLLKEAKREEQQIAGVMEARASTGVRLVEGPVRRR